MTHSGSPRRFYDGGLPAMATAPAQPPDPGRPARIELLRELEDGTELWAMERRIAFLDTHLGELLVPRDPVTFRTDLTSVPAIFTWLVPKTGTHLPAALIHDGLVGAPDYVSTQGHVVPRMEADRVLRDAMAVTGTGLIRRWLVWSAVSLATIASGSSDWSAYTRWRYRLTAGLSLLLTVYLGWCASWDLLDRRVPLTIQLPWMGDRSTPVELLGGLAGAIVVPFVLGLLWGAYRAAGTITCIALAILIHVTIVLLVLTAAYQLAEAFVRRQPRLALVLTVLVVVASAVVTATLAVS